MWLRRAHHCSLQRTGFFPPDQAGPITRLVHGNPPKFHHPTAFKVAERVEGRWIRRPVYAPASSQNTGEAKDTLHADEAVAPARPDDISERTGTTLVPGEV